MPGFQQKIMQEISKEVKIESKEAKQVSEIDSENDTDVGITR